MSDSKQEIADIIKVGIKTEIEGQKFYSALAQKIKNAEARKKIEALATDEVSHERRLRDLYREHVGGEPQDLPGEGLAIFKDAFGDQPLQEADKFRLLELAIEAERLTAIHYKKGEDKADDPSARKVFSELVAEEDGHYNMLMAEREGLRGNIHWFTYDDQAMLED
jgi:rubrerythrin